MTRSSAEHAGAALGYRPELDWLRGAAIALVMLHHGITLLRVPRLSWLDGGFLGVDLFFVLSGFLITTILIDRWNGSVRSFYGRRARRLLPALVAYLIVHAGVMLALHRDFGVELRTVGAALAYVSNLAPTFGWHLSGDQVHLWTLAVEEQFYIVWPFVALLVLRHLPPLTAARLLLVAAAAVAAWRWILTSRYGGFPIVYQRTDARADALLVGAALACAWCGGWRPPVRLVRAAGALGAAVFSGFVLLSDAFGAVLYRGGFTIVALAAAAMILVVVVDPGVARALPGARVMVPLGRISYSLYLWHVLVFLLTPALVPDPAPLRIAVGVSAAIGCAAVSYKCIERPFLAGPAARAATPVPAIPEPVPGSRPRRVPAVGWLPTIAVAAVALGALVVVGVGAGVAAHQVETRIPQPPPGGKG